MLLHTVLDGEEYHVRGIKKLRNILRQKYVGTDYVVRRKKTNDHEYELVVDGSVVAHATDRLEDLG